MADSNTSRARFARPRLKTYLNVGAKAEDGTKGDLATKDSCLEVSSVSAHGLMGPLDA